VAEAVKRLVKRGSRTRNVAWRCRRRGDHQAHRAAWGLSDQELEVQVESEANQYIPFSLDEVSLDFCVIGPSLSSAGDVDVLIAASRKEKVQDRQGLAEAAGLKPVVLDVESYASRIAAARLIEQLPGRARA
jgi:type IV pilus assembly protein PilM